MGAGETLIINNYANDNVNYKVNDGTNAHDHGLMSTNQSYIALGLMFFWSKTKNQKTFFFFYKKRSKLIKLK